ncbi:tRNA (adenosine(37)-N6)-threonylcarbamoyltransferase complex dimerization subunit type 1 TsaB [Solwaraspora sp. WMMA2080]|uniref:tRNA (adenosine(37)-N6)-threonylcarbamoyltransferase complex dimerization subunit type 1 TsaB n=1 Tax=unclassified Solwaraspora TaxID=2627926 RepID=UPI00248BD380|nr:MULTISPECIES: tRNA (adenosine(37)-N6)-threonylcarbamoyltransferase complex dimerization subunit type 1 TsaB [unclassified Solwaraspora]WBB96290.1 tRNA (adenosine(37)-N6)-threonylcarbamoyltransferase complex dimerization subunit type 1 TsaB [Solwaraspora sp. WMMA2059]WBC19807.1 tRNA (adenosine(37)-N6)-threonylcarbamoyltransferase complex dimerization subunit type 1 TsaB [Solwaraspora sp. WMMA2080]
MLVLVLDSSTPAVTAALAEITDDVRLLASRRTVDARAHGELLSPQIAACLAESGAAAADLTAVVAGLGPGPFTGLRVGLVTAASVAHALDIPTYGVNSLDALGHAAGSDLAGTDLAGSDAATGRVLAATDARRREIYWAVYAADGRRLTDPAVDAPAAVAEALAGLGVTTAVGDGALRYAELLGVPVRPEPRYPDALPLARLAADRVRTAALTEPLTPCYLRRPDAVAAAGRKPVLQ